MNLLREAFTWLTDPAQWSGPNSLLLLLGQHLSVLEIAGIALVIAASIGAVLMAPRARRQDEPVA